MTDQSNFEGAPQSEKLNGHFYLHTIDPLNNHYEEISQRVTFPFFTLISNPR